ncbi:hypothetical protein QBC47DRAFT_52760 [Echria macrotheca]|uniref:Uncharacterized protein n=1 Tax=Echria macrotheca TaxID=438768 RepID=A0AAJ0B7T5_9PEZI|nr:hypothetical protein QBC47DRAFT_52760 [Echria macrotheca]
MMTEDSSRRTTEARPIGHSAQPLVGCVRPWQSGRRTTSFAPAPICLLVTEVLPCTELAPALAPCWNFGSRSEHQELLLVQEVILRTESSWTCTRTALRAAVSSRPLDDLPDGCTTSPTPKLFSAISLPAAIASGNNISIILRKITCCHLQRDGVPDSTAHDRDAKHGVDGSWGSHCHGIIRIGRLGNQRKRVVISAFSPIRMNKQHKWHRWPPLSDITFKFETRGSDGSLAAVIQEMDHTVDELITIASSARRSHCHALHIPLLRFDDTCVNHLCGSHICWRIQHLARSPLCRIPDPASPLTAPNPSFRVSI